VFLLKHRLGISIELKHGGNDKWLKQKDRRCARKWVTEKKKKKKKKKDWTTFTKSENATEGERGLKDRGRMRSSVCVEGGKQRSGSPHGGLGGGASTREEK